MDKSVLRLLFFLSFLLPSGRASAQFLVNGTRDETVTAIKADSLGLLYFSSLRGLWTYDGRDISQLVIDENVNDFLLEGRREVWFCGQYYLARLLSDKRVERFIPGSYELTRMTALPQNRIAYIHHFGISVFDRDSLRVLADYPTVPTARADLAYDPSSGLLWFSSGNSVRMFDADLKPGAEVTLPPGCQIHSILPAKSAGAHLVLATSKGLFALDRKLDLRPIGQSATGGGSVLFLSSSSVDGTTLAAVEGKGFVRIYDDLSVEGLGGTLPEKAGVSPAFLLDRGHLWLSPDNAGLYLVPLAGLHQPDSSGPIEDFFTHKRIEILCEDSRHAIWALAGGAVFRFFPGARTVDRIVVPGLEGTTLSTMLVTSDDRLVLCSPDTACLFDLSFDGAGGVQLKENPLFRQETSVYSVWELPDNSLIFNTFQGTYRFAPGENRPLVPFDGYPLYSDPPSRTFIYSSQGRLSVLTGGQEITNAALLPEGENAQLVLADRSGSVWCITDRFRLYRIRPFEGRCESYDIPHWLPATDTRLVNPLFHSIQEDDGGNIWLGTSYGLVRINPADKSGFRLYNTGRKYDYYKASCKDQDGRLYFAYSNGLTVFDPVSEGHLVSNTGIRFSLRDIRVNDVSILTGPALPHEFPYTDNNFTFACSYVDYDNLQARFAWKLEGFDEDWRYGTEKNASYPNLPAGSYRFLLKIEGMPDSMAESYAFTIKRKPWTSPLAITLYVLWFLTLAALSAVSVRSRRKKREKERNQNLVRQVDRMKLDVFTNLSHEFRTPLTLISVPLKDMLYDGTITGESRTKLGVMERNVEKLQRLTDQLLEYDRIDKDFSRLDLRRKDIIRDLSEIAENFQYTAQKGGCTITVSSPCESIPFVYDDIKVGRVMSNLLNNAIKYSPEGGEISIYASLIQEQEAARIYRREFPSDCLEVRVADHGKGIPGDKLQAVFEKYTRADAAGNASVKGFGIGLHYTRQLVQAHGGEIIAEQNEPAGSVFRFVIPDNLHIPEADSVRPETAPAAGLVPSDEKMEYVSGLSILVVDDNDDLREYVMEMFSGANNVTGASDGQMGLEAVRSQYFDIVISDVMMPVMDGYALCRAIREDPELCALSVVLLTAKTDTLSQVQGLETGADAYVSKPFDPMYLRALINNIARRRAQRQDALVRTTSGTLDALPEEVAPVNPFDKKFLTDLYAILDAHLEQEEIDVNAVLQDMCMSRTSFYMKLKALTGQSPLQFINEYRMSRAAELLKSGQYSIKEVALMVGYQERRSFTTRFKTTFGCTPTEFLERK